MDEPRVHHQGSGDGDSLALAAGELVGITEQEVLRRAEPDQAQYLEYTLLALRHGSHSLDGEGLRDRVEHDAAGFIDS